MDKYEAQYAFWASFDVPAYEENSVLDAKEVTFPYITFQTVGGDFDSDTLVSASIWTRSTSTAQADEISERIFERLGGRSGGGYMVPYDGGAIWITPEDNFAQGAGDPDDDKIKRKLITVTYHFS